MSIKNVPFLDIPAPKTTAVLIKSSSDRSDSQAAYKSDSQAQQPKIFDSQSSTGCRNLSMSQFSYISSNLFLLRIFFIYLNFPSTVSGPSLRIKSETTAGLRLQIEDAGGMDADVVEVVHLLIERVALVLEGGGLFIFFDCFIFRRCEIGSSFRRIGRKFTS